MNDLLAAELGLIHRKVDGLLLAVHHILTRDPTMPASHKDVLDALTSNDTSLLGLAGNVKALVQHQADGAAAYDDILTRVTGQGSAMAALNETVVAVLPVEAPIVDVAPVAEAPVEVPAAPVVEAPVAPVAPAVPDLVIPGTV